MTSGVTEKAGRIAKPKIRSGIQVRDEGEGALVFVPDGDRILRANPAGSVILGLCYGRHSPEDIAGALAGRFEITREAAEADVRDYLARLTSLGLLDEA